MGLAQEKNNHSMVSDWQFKDPSTWNNYQRFFSFVDITPVIPGRPMPVFPKTAPVPVMASWTQHVYIIVYAAIPLLLQQAYVSYTGRPLGRLAVFFLYNLFLTLNAIREARVIRRLTYRYGCLDGDEHARDGVPNTAVGRIVGAMFKMAGFRIAMAAAMTYDPAVSPLAFFADPAVWPPFLLKLSLYGVVIDFYFYAYHRLCHEVPALWKYHRTHHLTKHPTAVLSAFADDEQEVIEMTLVPLLTFATLWAVGLPLSFYEWWICYEYVAYSEIFGHSGLRVHGCTPSLISPLLIMLNMDLALEDHDLHHRRGWKKSFNYGKQTRVWDRLFGTCADRVESTTDNIDRSKVVYMPIF